MIFAGAGAFTKRLMSKSRTARHLDGRFRVLASLPNRNPKCSTSALQVVRRLSDRYEFYIWHRKWPQSSEERQMEFFKGE